ncbi:DUF4931 domain-containing protein [Sandaracinus amylolyticus]|uniref:Galactose-1-phosphate uridylyltransferase n=1 Tax=Sandaracinus amylolyticus TaxID=927083 RepID=A0A0F6VZU4_9BACT|nr:DUF4931 domain-containing protein [Sandaracinus amylolyticus]AKF03640.1 Galactose-1-phosphate uridylyltransferase [Sandaracinus amylolyticus]
MSELRVDVFTGIPTVLAPGRRGIGTVRAGGLPDVTREACPFCPGREAETEETVLAIGDPWRVRVVANRYPLLARELAAHEVVIESPDHDGDLATYSASQALDVLAAIRARLRVLEAREGVASISVFRNRGRRAGSSQPHPHAQIATLPHVAPAIAMRDAIATSDRALLARVIDEERASGARVVCDEGEVIAWCPHASHRAFEVKLALAGECARFSALDDARLAMLARVLVDVTSRLRAVLGTHDYNVLLRDPAVGVSTFFTIDVLPRTGGDAGFELQSGTPVCVVAPEDAARALRDHAGSI